VLLLLFKFLCVDQMNLFQGRSTLRKTRLWQMLWFVQTAIRRDGGKYLMNLSYLPLADAWLLIFSYISPTTSLGYCILLTSTVCRLDKQWCAYFADCYYHFEQIFNVSPNILLSLISVCRWLSYTPVVGVLVELVMYLLGTETSTILTPTYHLVRTMYLLGTMYLLAF
jgi:hypothetical protein